eukprot:TRINITY_DN13679_c0_g2_i1.p1 TRINITY_DN13679_c0_g2~~TRINITY_DN13679_c0_g2_i1.p1  ORF type:complete len:269 (+),score=89.32 TRINITY_DN13679_c0_g2_i1:59-865(+)
MAWAGDEDEEAQDAFGMVGADDDTDDPVVGWSNGQALKKKDVQALVNKDKDAKRQYQEMKKKTQRHRKETEMKDPLAGLPATWKAFYNTVPNQSHSAQRAHEQYVKEKEQERQKRAREAEGATAEGMAKKKARTEEELVAEVETMDKQIKERRAKRLELKEAKAEWLEKVTRMRADDRSEEEEWQKTKLLLDKESYERGMLMGKRRSSDLYFQYLFDDVELTHKKQVMALQRSCSLVLKEISDLKGEIREIVREIENENPSTAPSRQA